MMNREQAIAYGKRIGVRYHIYNNHGCLVGGTKTREDAEAMKKRLEILMATVNGRNDLDIIGLTPREVSHIILHLRAHL